MTAPRLHQRPRFTLSCGSISPGVLLQGLPIFIPAAGKRKGAPFPLRETFWKCIHFCFHSIDLLVSHMVTPSYQGGSKYSHSAVCPCGSVSKEWICRQMAFSSTDHYNRYKIKTHYVSLIAQVYCIVSN